MAAKTVPIPQHIIDSTDDTSYFNLVNGASWKIGDVSRSGNNMLVSNIKLSRIRTVLGETTYDLASLLASENINSNSFYKPSNPPYSMGEIAGYNHYAKPSTHFATTFTTISLSVAADGANWKVTCPTELRRGERIPAYGGYVASWGNIKLVATLYEKDGLLQGDLLQTVTVTGVDVTRMFSSTINNIVIPVANTSTEYWLEIKAYYTYLTTDLEIEDSIRAVLTTLQRYLYDIISASTIIAPLEDSSIYSFNVKNNAPDTGNSQQYNGQFRTRFIYYETPDATSTTTVYGLSSSGITVNAQEIKAVSCTFSPTVGEYDNARAYSVTLYYIKDGSWIQFATRSWN